MSGNAQFLITILISGIFVIIIAQFSQYLSEKMKISELIDKIAKKKRKILRQWQAKKQRRAILAKPELEQDQSMLTVAIDSGICPDCGIWEMYEGPSGGMSTNIYCGSCGSHFNHAFGFSTQRINQVDVTNYNKAVPLKKEILQNWHQVKFSHGWNGKVQPEFRWCEQNCVSKWSVNSSHFYFEDQADATAFKLKWV